MSHFEEIDIKYADSPAIDAFGRARVSQVTTQFDAKQLHDKLPLFIDEVLGGGATATHSTINSETTLATALNTEYAIMQTKQKFNYQSGKSQLIFMTFSDFHVQTNIEKRIGYFSAQTTTPWYGTYDGLFLENDGTDISIRAYRSGTSTHNIPQSSWDDPLNGTGASGITVDWEKCQILALDFEWLGTGRVRWCLVINGTFVPFHYINNSNLTDNVYMSSPNQPLRWEIVQTSAGSGTFNYICGSVNSEGSINQTGRILSENTGTTHINANSTSIKYALIGIQLQATKSDTLIDLIDFTILSTTSDNQLLEVWLNPTVAGTFTYNAVTDSSVAIAKGATAGTNTVTGGTLIYSAYISQQQATPFNIENSIRLGQDIKGIADSIVVTCNPLTSNSKVLASMNWRELG